VTFERAQGFHGGLALGRLPDADMVHNGQPTTLHRLLAAPRWHVLLCGAAWIRTPPVDDLREVLDVHHITAPEALRRLGLTGEGTAQYLVRPDGHIGYRAGGTDVTGLRRYLARWLSG
jgi:hypothetical protein